MPPAIKFRPCEERDIPSVREFIHKHARAGHILSRDESLLRWQFDPSRAAPEGINGLSMVLAIVENGIGGTLGFLPFDLNIRGTVARGAWLSQLFSAPELRRYGVGMSLLWSVQQLKYDAVFGIGLNAAARKMATALRFEQIPQVPRWIRVFDPDATRDFLAQIDTLRESCAIDGLVEPYVISTTGPTNRRSIELDVEPWTESMSHEWDLFWQTCLAPALIGPARDAAYLRWRYVQHPTFHYQVRVARHPKSGDLLGLAAYRMEPVGDGRRAVMRIVEFLALPQARAEVAAMLANVAEQQNVLFADFFSTLEAAGSALEDVGFHRARQHEGRPVFPRRLQPPAAYDLPLSAAFWLTKDLRNTVQELGRHTDFYITKSDSDQDRPN